jgi:aldose 1-epimerase
MKKITILLMAITLCACKEKKAVDFIVIGNGKGMSASFTTYGARLVSLTVPDKNDKSTNVVWGFGDEAAYRNCQTDPYYGAIIGRYGNRIAKSGFRLDGKTYTLDQNDHANSLHGGSSGFHNRDWELSAQTVSSVTFSYLSKDGEGGYPGNLKVSVTFSISADNELKIDYKATTDKATVINLTNHAYWNLDGTGNGNILNHVLKIRASSYTPVDSLLIPMGKLDSVSGTPLDFRKGKAIGVRINDHHTQLHNGKGYDHNFVLDPHSKNTPVAEISSERSGIRMQVFTDQPGLQFYSGNFMAGKNTMNGGAKDNYRSGFCLETQHFPDSPNQPAFPSTVLRPGETYRSITTYQFSLLQSAPAGDQ